MVVKPTVSMPGPLSVFILAAAVMVSFFHVRAASQAIVHPPLEGVSYEAAASLERKIAQVLAADRAPWRSPSSESLVVTEEELESFVLYSLRDEIIPRIDSIDVGIEPGVISAATDLVLDSDLTSGNPLIDMLAQGSHSLFLEGALRAHEGKGHFELRRVWVDGVPVPLLFVDALIAQYVTPEYPAVDLDKPFSMPWGIEGISLSTGAATISY